MNFRCLGSLLVAVFAWAIGFATVPILAQVNVRYHPHWLDLPAETITVYVNDFALSTNGSGVADLALVAGWYTRGDRIGRQAFVYDHFGAIDPMQPEKFWDIQELVGTSLPAWVPPTHVASSFTGVNAGGRLCGYVEIANPQYSGQSRLGMFLDLSSPVFQLQQLPSTSSTANEFYARRVNENGDILVLGSSTGSFQHPEICLFNPITSEKIDVVIPTEFTGPSDIFLNAGRQLLGVIPGDNPWGGSAYGSGVYRHTVIDLNNDGISDGFTETFNNLSEPRGINDAGQFSCTLTVAIPRNRRTIDYKHYGARIGADGTIEWNTGFGTWQGAGPLNDSGDMLHYIHDESLQWTDYLYYEGDPQVGGDESEFVDLIGLIDGGSSISPEFAALSNRDETGFGWIAGRGDAEGNGTRDLMLLIPELSAGPLVYSSIDTPLSIPDNNAAGVSSNIAVPEDLTIGNLTVTLNISHSRPSDLQASLIGPNSAVVPLPILNGINDIAAFDGTSSQGTWTVKVVDSVNKKTGTLNGWTLTIE
jgi:hypothetical protein